MNENTIATLVVIAVLVTAVAGLYIAFVQQSPSEGRSIEGAKEYYYAHQMYEYGPSYELAKRIRESPRKELPSNEMWEGACVAMFNPRSSSIIPVPVGRHMAKDLDDSVAVEMMETRGWVVVDVMAKKGDTICPPPSEMPSVNDIMEAYGL